MAINNENHPVVVPVALGSLTTDGTLLPALHITRKSKIKSVKLMNGANVAASDSNYVQVALKSGSTVIAELDSRAAHENGLVINEAKSLNLVEAESMLAEGVNLTALYNETGTVALTNAVLLIELFPV